LINTPISENDFRCKYNNKVVHTKRIESLPSTWFKNVSTLLSFQNKTDTSRIYIEGFGTANEYNYEHSKIIARDRAIKDMYGMIIDNLYGIRVEKTFKDYFVSKSGFESISPINKSFVSSTIVVSSHGVIDKKSLIIFNEDFEKLNNGTICCSLKGYYELPWMTNKFEYLINLRDIISNLDFKEQVAIEREGERKIPEWISNPHSDADAIYGYGQCTVKKIPKEISKRIAMYRSIGNIVATLNTKINSRFKTLTDKTGTPHFSELISKSITDMIIKKVKIVEYYFTNDSVFVLSKLNKPFFTNKTSAQNPKKKSSQKKHLNFEEFQKALDSMNFSD